MSAVVVFQTVGYLFLLPPICVCTNTGDLGAHRFYRPSVHRRSVFVQIYPPVVRAQYSVAALVCATAGVVAPVWFRYQGLKSC